MIYDLKSFRLAGFAKLARVCADAALLLSLAACSSRRDVSEGVQMLLNTERLEPTTTFELRFEEPMALTEEVGKPATNSPLLIKPPLAGSFVWLSTRSGLFTPREPAELGQAYDFSLRPGLIIQDAALAPSTGTRYSRARLHRVLHAPALEVTDAAGLERESGNASSKPQIILQFNERIMASDAKAFCDFRDAGGVRVPAEVRQATVNDYFYHHFRGLAVSPLTWKEQFYRAQTAPGIQKRPRPPKENEDESVLNRLVVTPMRPLPAAVGWRLVVSRDLPSPETSSRLTMPYEAPIGNVTLLSVESVRADNFLHEGKRLTINFSKQISSAITTNNWGEWISISPCPAKLWAFVQNHGLRFYGDFLLNTHYTVVVRAGFPAEEPFRLPGEITRLVKFEQLQPRLYFPAFSAAQLEGGLREFHLLALNIPEARVRAKQLDRHTLIHALRGYGSYYKHHFEEYDYVEPYREVDFNLVPGRTIFDRVINSGVDVSNTPAHFSADRARKIALDWDEILGTGKPGVVFLAADEPAEDIGRRKRIGTQCLVQLTDLGMVWKRSRDEMLVWVFSHATGQPKAGVSVWLMSDDNEALAEGKTDGQGVASISYEPKSVSRSRKHASSAPGWLLAEAGDDLYAMRLEENGVPLYGFGIPIDWSMGEPGHRALMFSDRPLYRPGEVAQFKAIVRASKGGELLPPAPIAGVFRCYDAKGRKFLDTNVVFSPLGSWSSSVRLPDGTLGQYHAELRIGNEGFSHWFHVQEFQPNAFEISLPAKKAYPPSEKLELPLAARYYMGKSLSRAKVRWSLEAEDAGFAPEGFEDFVFGTAISTGDLGRNASSLALQGEGMLTNKENFLIRPNLAFNPKAPQPRSVHLLAEVSDVNQQTLSQSIHFTCFSSDFYLGFKRFKDVLREGEALPVQLVAVQWDGTPQPSPVQTHLTFQHIEWRTVRIQGAGRVRGYRSEPVITNLLEQDVLTQPVQHGADKWEIQPGSTPAVLVPPEPGLYLIEARSKDAAGREVVTAATINVCGKDEVAWNYRNEAQMDLVPDQKSYSPAETATILVKAPFSGTALVTVEREHVARSFLAELAGNAPAIRLPIETNDAPNIFVSVTLVRGADQSPKKFKSPEYRMGYCQLLVTNPATRLDVSVQTDASDYRPGEQVRVVAVVRDAVGQPVPEAEVTLYAVDEGILSLAGYSKPDAHATFFEARPLSVRSGLSLPDLLPEDPERLEFHNKGYIAGGGGGHSGRVRKSFLACAFWNATLLTGKEGEVAASFPAPDSLTRYRVIAVAHSAGNLFGGGETRFEINKPLMLEPALPRFANVTDRVLARAVVHNQTDEAGEIEVTLRLDDKAKTPGTEGETPGGTGETPVLLSRVLVVPARSSSPVEFPVEFTEAGAAKWIWNARFAKSPGAGTTSPRPFTDAVESTLAVGHVTPLLRETYLSRSEAIETNLLAHANPQLLEGKGAVTVHISNTRLSELGETVSQLLHYPYGCVEQTSSSLLPWLVLGHLPAAIPRLNRASADAEAAIQGGIKRLFSMQTDAGGLSYWPGGKEPMLWGSAYGGMVLALASREGLAVPEADFGRLLDYLRQQLRGSGDAHNLSERCLALYALALAGRKEAAYQELLFSKRSQLSSESRAWLALAILESKGPSSMTEDLLRSSSANQENDYFGSPSREVAVRLLAWTHFQPSAPVVDVLVQELMQEQTQAHWGSTQGDAWALYAITEYAARVETGFSATTGSVRFGGQATPFELAGKPSSVEVTFPFSPARASSPLVLANPARRKLFTTVHLETRPRAIQASRVDRGYLIRRTYSRVDDDGRGSDPRQLRVGDSVLVSLRVEVRQPAHYVVVDDPLPAILEAINPEFKSRQGRNRPATYSGSDIGLPAVPPSEYWWSDFQEFRTDRALFFRDHVGPGTHTIRYLARVRAAGSVTAPPAKIEEMYHPDRFGLSATEQATSLPLE